MVLKVVIILALVALAKARRAPNADYVEDLLKQLPQSRYSNNIAEDAALDAPGLIQKYGYPQETHNVITSDGYMLEMHRIPHGRDKNNKPGPRIPVLVMHGLLSSSADFLVLGPGNALAYTLAEAGYDVWLGNARGNFYSRQHRSLNPNSILNQRFWQFSWDEIGRLDLAAFVDLIIERTGQEKVHYIGHSQGGTSFLVLTSLRPEYNDKFISFQGLAPASYFDNNEHSIFSALAPMENIIESAAFAMGKGEIFGNQDFMNWFITNYCRPGSIFVPVCQTVVNLMIDGENYNTTMIPLFLAHAPAGASIRQVAHYGQVIRFKSFRRYNYNAITNLAEYGRLTPPEYDVSKITTPAYLHYGLNDLEVNYRDIFLLAERLGNTIGLYKIKRDSFNHYDFIWANDAKAANYDTVVKCMRDAERRL